MEECHVDLGPANVGRGGDDGLAGATDRATFDQYVEQVLAPELRPGDVVVWDNLSSHKGVAAIAAIEAAGARVEPLPVYNPDLSPIEEMFSNVKAGLRTITARTIETVIGAMGQVLIEVTQHDILGSRTAARMQSIREPL